MKQYTVTILGAGAWGSALACVMQSAGHAVRLWARKDERACQIMRGENPEYLPGISLPSGIFATSSAGCALEGSDCVLSAVPVQSFGQVLDQISDFVPSEASFVLCSKGIHHTGMRLSEIARKLLPRNPLAVLSGPAFACDVARGLPVAVVVASCENDLAHALALRFSTPFFRCYYGTDLVGVEIAGALKNVLAIAAGAIIGKGLGESACAAMISRGFSELSRVVVACGGRFETATGLSGLGDLFLTCSSRQSRNFSYGLALAGHRKLLDMPLAEGVATAAVAARIAREAGLDTPLLFAVEAVVHGSVTVDEAVDQLMSRALRSELY